MEEYKDFAFVQYLLNLEFKQAFTLFQSCLKIKNEREQKAKFWDLFLLEVENGYKESFENYYEMKIKENEINNLSKEEKETKEKRILEKYASKNKVVEKVIE